VIPGNIYPVCENPKSNDSLVGSAVKGGYQSHFVITTKEGIPVENPVEICFSELVIFQEAQCVPAFILRLEISKMNDLLIKYERTIVEPQKDVQEQIHHGCEQ